MQRNLFCLFICLAQNCLFVAPTFAQHAKDETAIRTILAAQEQAWNTANLEGFMAGYWQSNELRFIGKSGITKGWQATLDNYKKSYPTPDAMGKLDFTILSLEFLSCKTAFVVGKWHLKREKGDLEGHFTLLWKKIKGKWCIVADHSS